MSDYAQIALYALLALVVSLVLPAVTAALAGLYALWRDRRNADDVELIVGDFPHIERRSNESDHD